MSCDDVLVLDAALLIDAELVAHQVDADDLELRGSLALGEVAPRQIDRRFRSGLGRRDNRYL